MNSPEVTLLPDLPDLPAGTRVRSGTAARLAGLPATTLRVWERRYAVIAAPKSTTGQRQYSGADVRRLALLRHLTEQGHAIGSIAALPMADLQGLAAAAPARSPGSVVVVGATLARRLAALPGAPRLEVHPSLAAAEAADQAARDARALLVQCDALQPADAAPMLDLAAHRDLPLTVVYRFGSEPAVASLRAQGATVHREPVDLAALARTLAGAAVATVAPRRFSDDDLAHLAALPSAVLCECPRHLAELVGQLAGFEQYSADCESRNPADAALHRRLHTLAGAARQRFEQALADVMAAEGLALPRIAGG